MLAVLSPAKTLDFATDHPFQPTEPRFAKEARAVARAAKALPQAEIARLMALSEPLAALTHGRFKAFHRAETRPAIAAFAGDVYRGLDARSLAPEHHARLAERVRILSGHYGLLRPTDAIAPHRLEMGTRWAPDGGASLPAWWAAKVVRALDRELAGRTLLNLASAEYAAVLAGLKSPRIDVRFLHGGRTVGVHAKRARGLMARFLATDAPETADDLRAFAAEGWAHDPAASTSTTLVFARAA